MEKSCWANPIVNMSALDNQVLLKTIYETAAEKNIALGGSS